jgi:hypothetical protein
MMSVVRADLIFKVIYLLESDLGQVVKNLAKKLGADRTFLAGNLNASDREGYVNSVNIRLGKVYFKGSIGE